MNFASLFLSKVMFIDSTNFNVGICVVHQKEYFFVDHVKKYIAKYYFMHRQEKSKDIDMLKTILL